MSAPPNNSARSSSRPADEASPPSTPAVGQKFEGNPLVQQMNVTMSMPADIEIAFVQLGHVEDYEMWFLLSSLSTTTLVGFLVAYILNPNEIAFGLFSLFLTAMSAAFVYKTLTTRSKLHQVKKFKLEVAAVKESK